LIEEHIAETFERLDRDSVLEAGQGRLAGQVAIVGGAVGHQLEDGIGTEGVMVVLVLVSSEDALGARPDHLQERMFGEIWVAGVIEGLGKSMGQADVLVKLAEGQQPGITGELAVRQLDDDRRTEEVEALRPEDGILISDLCGWEKPGGFID
jgi:hypothetical protein